MCLSDVFKPRDLFIQCLHISTAVCTLLHLDAQCGSSRVIPMKVDQVNSDSHPELCRDASVKTLFQMLVQLVMKFVTLEEALASQNNKTRCKTHEKLYVLGTGLVQAGFVEIVVQFKLTYPNLMHLSKKLDCPNTPAAICTVQVRHNTCGKSATNAELLIHH